MSEGRVRSRGPRFKTMARWIDQTSIRGMKRRMDSATVVGRHRAKPTRVGIMSAGLIRRLTEGCFQILMFIECCDMATPKSVLARELQAKITKALNLANVYGNIDGDHHKMWVIDQIVRTLTGRGYRAWVKAHNAGEDGPHTYDWGVGIPP